MITRDIALNSAITELHFGDCKQRIGPKGSVVYVITRVRRDGACKTYKSRANDWSLPIKSGLLVRGYINPQNAHEFHTAADCPLAQPEKVRERELAEKKRHVGTILIRLAKQMDAADQRKLFKLTPDQKLEIAIHSFPEAAARIVLNQNRGTRKKAK